ncbi:MAG TPA: M20/M25/M40 family metallo-hydrolase, partial [Arthrobacter sp.]
MLTLRKHVLPSVLAFLLLTATACTSESAAGARPDFLPEEVTSGPGSGATSAGPGAAAPRLGPASAVDARRVLAEFRGRGMVEHLEALQRIADDNDGNRASGTSGYEESARYVEDQLRAAGYTPVRQEFTYRSDDKRVKTFNILADTEGSAENTVVVGGHLDSVPAGPGINDNSSGVAAVLETARWMKESGITPANRVRFAFWGAEEAELDGSQHYIDELSAAGVRRTALYLNADMVASPNGVRSINDGDGSDFGKAGPKGSREIEDVFFRFFRENSLPAETTPLDGESDYEPFQGAGIPVGGLFSGDSESKTRAQAQAFGGVAGKGFDACYHKACDTVDNTNADLLKEMSAALAYAT